MDSHDTNAVGTGCAELVSLQTGTMVRPEIGSMVAYGFAGGARFSEHTLASGPVDLRAEVVGAITTREPSGMRVAIGWDGQSEWLLDHWDDAQASAAYERQ